MDESVIDFMSHRDLPARVIASADEITERWEEIKLLSDDELEKLSGATTTHKKEISLHNWRGFHLGAIYTRDLSKGRKSVCHYLSPPYTEQQKRNMFNSPDMVARLK